VKQNVAILALAAALILAALNMPASVTDPLSAFLRDAVAPLSGALARAPRLLRRGAPGAGDPGALAEIARLRVALRQTQALERENQALRRMLGLATQSARRLIAAELSARDVNAWWQSARLNKGARDGLALDMPVITPDGLAGRLVRVSRTTSDVLFLVDPACRVAARIVRPDAFGIVRGLGVSARGQAACRMEYLPKDVRVLPGDDVETSELGGLYPPGLLIGRVRRVRLDDSGLYQTAEIEPAANFRSLALVFVMDTAADAEEGRP